MSECKQEIFGINISTKFPRCYYKVVFILSWCVFAKKRNEINNYECICQINNGTGFKQLENIKLYCTKAEM